MRDFYGNNSDWNYLLMNTHMTSDGNTISFDNLSKDTENEDEKNNDLITKQKAQLKIMNVVILWLFNVCMNKYYYL